MRRADWCRARSRPDWRSRTTPHGTASIRRCATTFDPDDLLRITLEIEAAGLDLVGIFHSHTHTPAVPSATDLRAAMYPEPFYILATLADPDATPERSMRAWRIRGGQSIERPLRIEGDD